MTRIANLLGCLTALSLVFAQVASAQSPEEGTVQAAGVVLNETMASAGHQLPQAMLADAYGVAIIPNVIKGSFIVGARHGRGLLFIREENGIWRAPVFITLTGGNIGWQVGLQSSDIILVFKTPKSVEGVLSGRLTLGADAAVAAGPVGRQAAAATDERFQAEIYAYSRSRGLFAGVSIDGSVLRMDQFATSAYYRSPAPGQPVIVPPSAQQLTQTIVAYASAQHHRRLRRRPCRIRRSLRIKASPKRTCCVHSWHSSPHSSTSYWIRNGRTISHFRRLCF